jgi:hypothetical protein
MHHQDCLTTPILSHRNPPDFRDAVLVIWNRKGQRIVKDFGGSLKSDAMLGHVGSRLGWVPLELKHERRD